VKKAFGDKGSEKGMKGRRADQFKKGGENRREVINYIKVTSLNTGKGENSKKRGGGGRISRG